jgi:purine-binding chemotaxis protein CheW
MDFLEIRRKAKERAAARAAEARATPGQAPAPVAPAGPSGGAPAPPATSAPPAAASRPAAGAGRDPAVERRSTRRSPAESRRTEAQDEPPPTEPVTGQLRGVRIAPVGVPPVRRGPRPGSPEALRLEAELAARLATLPPAADPRFVTWRPEGGPLPELEDAAGPEAEPPAPREPARGPASLDPLDDFFFRADERAPELADLPTAAPEAPVAEPVEREEFLTFRLAGDEYGVAIGRVTEVMRSAIITEVPRAPPDVLGVITVRGEVVAIFDPRRRLGLPPGKPADGGRLVIVDDGLGPCGLLVDAVVNVVRLPRGRLEPCPQGINVAGADAMEGIGRDQERLFTVLDVAALLRPLRRSAEAKSA